MDPADHRAGRGRVRLSRHPAGEGAGPVRGSHPPGSPAAQTLLTAPPVWVGGVPTRAATPRRSSQMMRRTDTQLWRSSTACGEVGCPQPGDGSAQVGDAVLTERPHAVRDCPHVVHTLSPPSSTVVSKLASETPCPVPVVRAYSSITPARRSGKQPGRPGGDTRFDVVKDGWEELRATPSGATRTATLMMQRRVREIPVGRCRPDRSLQPLRWLGWSTWSGRHPRNIRVVGSAGASDGTAANARPLHLIHGGASVISRLPSAQPQCQDRVRPGAPHHLVDGDVLVHCVREDCLAGAVLQRRHSGHCVLSQV